MTEEAFSSFLSDWFPVDGDILSCGLRRDIPRKQRRHEWVPLGPDWKNRGERGLVQVEVRACLLCGKDGR